MVKAISEQEFQEFFEKALTLDKMARETGKIKMAFVVLWKDGEYEIVGIPQDFADGQLNAMDVLAMIVESKGGQMYMLASEAWTVKGDPEKLPEPWKTKFNEHRLRPRDLPDEHRKEVVLMIGQSVFGHKRSEVFDIERNKEGRITKLIPLPKDTNEERWKSRKLPGNYYRNDLNE